MQATLGTICGPAACQGTQPSESVTDSSPAAFGLPILIAAHFSDGAHRFRVRRNLVPVGHIDVCLGQVAVGVEEMMHEI